MLNEDINNNIILDLDYLVDNFQYSHLWKCNEDLLNNKLETLELIERYNNIKLYGHIGESELTIVLNNLSTLIVDLEFLNKNIKTIQKAMQLTADKATQNSNIGSYFLN